MVYQRNTDPDEKTVIKEAPAAEHRVVYDEIPNRIAIEHGSGTRVYQGLRYEDPEVVDRLIDALQEYRSEL